MLIITHQLHMAVSCTDDLCLGSKIRRLLFLKSNMGYEEGS